jgi:hypothetical protein
MASEKLFENQVKKFLHGVGIYAAGTPIQKMTVEQRGWYFKEWGGGYSKSGIPDLIICANGFFIACELKGPTGKPSELQGLNVMRINQSNGIAMILYPEGFENFKNIVKGVMKCNSHIQELMYLKTANTSTSCNILTS